MKLTGAARLAWSGKCSLFVSADGADAASSRHQAAHARAHAQHTPAPIATAPGATPRAVAAIMGK